MPIKVMYRIDQLEVPEIQNAVSETEKYIMKVEGKPLQNVAATIGYAVRNKLLFNPDGTLYERGD